MGLLITVCRPSSEIDCTNDGISSRFDKLVVVNVPGPFEATPKMPGVRLEHTVMGSPILVPVDKPTGVIGPMEGGNFGYCGDSRFRRACDVYAALPIHDRFETQATADFLSR